MAIPFATSEVVTAAEMNELTRAHWRKVTSKQVVNTVTATDLLNGEITIDAGAMSTNRAVRLTAWGDMKQNSGGTTNFLTFDLRLGPTPTSVITMAVAAATWANSASRWPWKLEAIIANQNSASVQTVSFEAVFAGSSAAVGTTAFTTGEGATTSNPAGADIRAVGYNTAAINTANSMAIILNVALQTANAAVDCTLAGALVELI